MGYKLYRTLRDAFGPQITTLQRLVAFQIALDARDPDEAAKPGDTRKPCESRVSIENLVRWSGAKDARVVRTILQQLAGEGWEFRVPIGTGTDGRKLYAVPGMALNFYVPLEQGPKKPKKPRPEGKKASQVASQTSQVASQTEASQVASEQMGVASEASQVASQTSQVGPYVLPSTFSDLLSTSLASRSEAPAAPSPTEEGREGGEAEEQHHAAVNLLRGIDLGRATTEGERKRLVELTTARLADGWAVTDLRERIDGNWNGAVNRVAVLHTRLKELPARPPSRRRSRPVEQPVPQPPSNLATPEQVAERARQARDAMRAGRGYEPTEAADDQ